MFLEEAHLANSRILNSKAVMIWKGPVKSPIVQSKTDKLYVFLLG